MPYDTKICLTLFISIVFSLLACSGGEMESKRVTYKDLNSIPADTWEKLSKKKIYFGHQSVGYNIMDGIETLIKENPQIKLNIVETDDISDFDKGIFAHSKVGKNTKPDTKITEFESIIETGIGKKVDAAALKFCYVDVVADTDVNQLFDRYVKSTNDIKKKHPNITVIHFTTPLKTSKTSWKTWIKKILGKKEIWEYSDNIKRNQYNELLRAKYEGLEPIFDIATIESTFSDGKRSTFEYDGKKYYAMAAAYSNDGGHLNSKGKRRVATEFLIFLANQL